MMAVFFFIDRRSCTTPNWCIFLLDAVSCEEYISWDPFVLYRGMKVAKFRAGVQVMAVIRVVRPRPSTTLGI